MLSTDSEESEGEQKTIVEGRGLSQESLGVREAEMYSLSSEQSWDPYQVCTP